MCKPIPCSYSARKRQSKVSWRPEQMQLPSKYMQIHLRFQSVCMDSMDSWHDACGSRGEVSAGTPYPSFSRPHLHLCSSMELEVQFWNGGRKLMEIEEVEFVADFCSYVMLWYAVVATCKEVMAIAARSAKSAAKIGGCTPQWHTRAGNLSKWRESLLCSTRALRFTPCDFYRFLAFLVVR